MRKYDNLMRKRSDNLIIFEKCVHEKSIIFEKGVIVYTLAGCSKMRVGEGSHTKIISEKCEKLKTKKLKSRSRKSDEKV